MNKFKLFLENSYKRMNSFGFSPNDVVTIRKDACSHKLVKSGSDLFQKAVAQLIEDKVMLCLKKFDLEMQKPIDVYGPYAILSPLIGPNWVGQSEFMLPTDLLELAYTSRDSFQMHQKPETVVKESKDSGDSVTKLSTRERIKISNEFRKAGLDGNGRFDRVGLGISKIAQVLNKCGFDLDMVTNDIEVASAHHNKEYAEGQRTLTFRRKIDLSDSNVSREDDDAFSEIFKSLGHEEVDERAFDENPEISNSRIAMSWHSKGRFGFEILAYPS